MSSIGIRTVAFLMAVYGLSGIWIAWSEEESWNLAWRLWYTAWGSFALAGAVFLVLEKTWSRFVVYVIASANIAVYVYLTVVGAQRVSWPYNGVLATVIAFAPGILFGLICIGSCCAVHFYFQAKSIENDDGR